MSKIPTRERWLHENPESLASVMHGIEQSRKEKVKKLGLFSETIKRLNKVYSDTDVLEEQKKVANFSKKRMKSIVE